MGSLDSIISLSCSNMLDDCSFVSRGKLGWTSSTRVFLVWVAFLDKVGHSGFAYSSSRGNLVSREASIRQREDIISLSRGDGFPGDYDYDT
jgi:hypothetical protein